ncbi:Group II intron-encoded protein LtrA [Rubripirellula tenax]|uniref:Group II intron-encoded protein LtrA n=1 Tax=Rubripirellula tenax TaxID=2528015 RepID=A0A5C6EYY1_9BACT|nr:group II intron reverse transcriptase/maturase [Rubripirellula tenax]TWU54863.1 Group II intron-encoded protein LtrA [Rubripirellula tenax]
MTSKKPNASRHTGAAHKPQPSPSTSAAIEKPALDSQHQTSLVEEAVDDLNMEMAWAKVKANCGAPGPDGITVEDFADWFTPRWQQIKTQLLEGTYRPAPVRRKSIPKPDGGERHLGIPNVVDRLVQQAIAQVLTPIFDPEFSESSFGYRPYRDGHGAVKQIQTIIRSGYHWCVDMDLSKFFDTVQHDVLMARVSRKVHDKQLLKLIGKFLRGGVMVLGCFQPSKEGTMQGGPLSPLLANILLDDLDKELEQRGLPFVRYADDFIIFVKSEAAAHRVFGSVERYLQHTLKLIVNREKSYVRRADGVEFVGYEFRGYGGKICVSEKKLRHFKRRASELLARKGGRSMVRRMAEFTQYARGWIGYFALEQRKSVFTSLDKWLRRRVRACYWKSWRLPRTRIRKLKALGISHEDAYMFGASHKAVWRLSMTSGVQRALSNDWLKANGLFSLEERWSELAPLRRTA